MLRPKQLMMSPTPAVRVVSDARCIVSMTIVATLASKEACYIVRMG